MRRHTSKPVERVSTPRSPAGIDTSRMQRSGWCSKHAATRRRSIVGGDCPVAERLKLVEQQLDIGRHIVRDENERARLLRRLGHVLRPDAKPEAEDVGALAARPTLRYIRGAARTLERHVEVRAIPEELRANSTSKRQLLHFRISGCKKRKSAITRPKSQYCLSLNERAGRVTPGRIRLPRHRQLSLQTSQDRSCSTTAPRDACTDMLDPGIPSNAMAAPNSIGNIRF